MRTAMTEPTVACRKIANFSKKQSINCFGFRNVYKSITEDCAHISHGIHVVTQPKFLLKIEEPNVRYSESFVSLRNCPNHEVTVLN